MNEVAVYDAKTRLSEMLVEVEQGAQFVITRRGIPVAHLVAATPPAKRRSAASAQRQRVAQAFEDLALLRAGTSLDIPLREAIEQGRD